MAGPVTHHLPSSAVISPDIQATQHMHGTYIAEDSLDHYVFSGHDSDDDVDVENNGPYSNNHIQVRTAQTYNPTK